MSSKGTIPDSTPSTLLQSTRICSAENFTMQTTFRIFVVFLLVGYFGSCQESSKSVSEVLKEILTNYDKNVSPYSDRPTKVKVGMYVISVSVEHGQLSMAFYFRQSWTDPRLTFSNSTRIPKNALQASPNAIERIWKPDTFFRNEITSKRHELLTEQRMLRIKTNGSVWFVNHLSATFNCPMLYTKFPFDVQQCPIMIESFGQTMDTLFLSFLEQPIQMAEDLQLPSWTFVDNVLYDCSQNYTTGSYTCLEFRLILRRDIGYYIRQIYLPSILVVLLSWITFWIDRKASTARMNLGLATIVLMVILCTAVDSLKPNVSYITAIDLWIGVCGTFVCLALVEFVVVHFLANRKAAGLNHGSDDIAMDAIKRSSKDQKSVSPLQQKIQQCVEKLDLISRIVFPILFLIFNVIYWIAYII